MNDFEQKKQRILQEIIFILRRSLVPEDRYFSERYFKKRILFLKAAKLFFEQEDEMKRFLEKNENENPIKKK